MANKVSAALENPTDLSCVSIESAQEVFSRATIELLRREPFFGHLLASIPRIFSEKIPTIAVVLRENAIQLVVNPCFIVRELRGSKQKAAVIKHEVLHIVFKHLFRANSYGEDRLLWNIAADLVVNQYIPPFPVPDGAILLSTFPDLELEADDTIENYFDTLKKLSRSRKGEHSPAPISARALSRLKRQGIPGDHSAWENGTIKEFDGEIVGPALSEMLREALTRSVDNHILRAHRRIVATRGSRPNWLERIVSDIQGRRKPKVSWNRVFRIFSASGRRTRLRTTLMKESRRFEGIDGVVRSPGISVHSRHEVAVIIDTSGSIDDLTLKKFFDEVDSIYRQGTEIIIVECDAEVKRHYRYDGRVLLSVIGGGGANFEPAMRWLRSPGQRRFDACIYLTDGDGILPETRPPCPLLWVLSSPASSTRMPFGRQIEISE